MAAPAAFVFGKKNKFTQTFQSKNDKDTSMQDVRGCLGQIESSIRCDDHTVL